MTCSERRKRLTSLEATLSNITSVNTSIERETGKIRTDESSLPQNEFASKIHRLGKVNSTTTDLDEIVAPFLRLNDSLIIDLLGLSLVAESTDHAPGYTGHGEEDWGYM